MSIAVGVLAWIGAILAGLALLVLIALVWPVRVQVLVDAEGGSGSVSWLGWRYGQDRRARTWELRFAGLRVARRTLDEGEDDTAAEAEPKPKKGKKGRRLSAIGVVRLARAGLREVQGLVHRIRVDRLRATVVVSTPDPATTGELFGYGTAFAYALRGGWPDVDVRLGVDFVAATPRGSIDAAVGTRPIWWAAAAARLGWLFLRERRRSGR